MAASINGWLSQSCLILTIKRLGAVSRGIQILAALYLSLQSELLDLSHVLLLQTLSSIMRPDLFILPLKSHLASTNGPQALLYLVM